MLRPAAFAALAFAALAGTAAVSAPAYAKACTGGICAESRSDGRRIHVYLSDRLNPVTHYNIRRNGVQYELKPGQTFSFPLKKGYKQYYSVQACNRGGLFNKSSCTGWVRFYHTS